MLERLASRPPAPTGPEFDRARQSLLDFGLLRETDGEIEPAGELFRRWIASERKKGSSRSVFIGHGHNQIWTTVSHFLEKKLDLHVVSYEDEPRAGQTIVRILEDMLGQAEFAVLVLTAEDRMEDGKKRARQNVVHEVGYAQGRLGFQRVVLLVQDGAEEITNIAGLQYLPFEGDNIKATFPELLAFFLTGRRSI
jgi:predicted nucleotide-binding protein